MSDNKTKETRFGPRSSGLPKTGPATRPSETCSETGTPPPKS